jgi:excisionase family DNA binding protein
MAAQPPCASAAAPNAERPNGPVPLLDAAGAAELLNVPKSWVLAEARADRIPHVRLGKYVRFEEDELRAWWASRRRGPWRQRSAAAASARTGGGPVRDGGDGA